MNINKIVKQEAAKVGKPERKITVPAPYKRNPKKWLRFDCPFCAGRKHYTAAINYDAGWFECYRCHKKLWERQPSKKRDDWRPDHRQARAKESELFNLFKGPIADVTRIVKRRFGKWYEKVDLKDQATLICWNYAYGAPGLPNDSGMLEQWEADCEGDISKI